MLKYLTDRDTKNSIAVNPDAVLYVVDMAYGPKIILEGGIFIVVEEPYIEVVAHLNSRD